MRDLRFRKAVPMILLVAPLLILIFAEPFVDPAQAVIEVLYLGLIAASMAASSL